MVSDGAGSTRDHRHNRSKTAGIQQLSNHVKIQPSAITTKFRQLFDHALGRKVKG
jgi:hypothetical protein